jgi:hypothetical protein
MPADPPQTDAAPPDAVRVWRGFRQPTVANDKFCADLGAIFIPVTVQMQRLFKLTAYLPAVLPANKPAGVPDEIALVFYASQQDYTNASLAAGGRAYSLLHATIFDLGRSLSGFPKPLAGGFVAGTPFHLFDDDVDWQTGFAQVFVGAERNATDPALFSSELGAFCAAQQSDRPPGLDGAIMVAENGYAIYWEHWLTPQAAQSSRIGDLAAIAAPVLLEPYSPVAVPTALDAVWPGLQVSGGECFNTQFDKLAKA